MKTINKLYETLRLLESEINNGTPEDKTFMLPVRQLLLLTYIYNNEGCNQRELAKRSNSKESATAKHLKLLKELKTPFIPEGLLYSQPDLNDYKANNIYMTEAGKNIMKKIEKWLQGDIKHES